VIAGDGPEWAGSGRPEDRPYGRGAEAADAASGRRRLRLARLVEPMGRAIRLWDWITHRGPLRI